jgi:hypothetical protein
MKKQYLHLSAYPCDLCAGPVVTGAVAVRENEISKETDIRQVGAMCLTCGHRQSLGADLERVRHMLPIEWNPESGTGHLTAAYAEAVNRVKLH